MQYMDEDRSKEQVRYKGKRGTDCTQFLLVT